MKKCPAPQPRSRPTDKTSAPAVRKPISSCFASWLRSVNRAAESGTEAMIACHVGDLLVEASRTRNGIQQFVIVHGLAGRRDRRQRDARDRDRQLGRVGDDDQAKGDGAGRHPVLPPVAVGDAAAVTAMAAIAMNDAISARCADRRASPAPAAGPPRRRPRAAAHQARRRRAATEPPAPRRPPAAAPPRPAGSRPCRCCRSGSSPARCRPSTPRPSTAERQRPPPAVSGRRPRAQRHHRDDQCHDRNRQADKAMQRRAVELRRLVEHRDRVDDVLDQWPVTLGAADRHQGQQRAVDHPRVVERFARLQRRRARPRERPHALRLEVEACQHICRECPRAARPAP